MDVDDIRGKFGNKYDDGIEQMKRYTETLNNEREENGLSD